MQSNSRGESPGLVSRAGHRPDGQVQTPGLGQARVSNPPGPRCRGRRGEDVRAELGPGAPGNPRAGRRTPPSIRDLAWPRRPSFRARSRGPVPLPAPPGPGLRSARPGGPPSALRVPPRAAPLQAGPRARPLPWPPGSRAPPPVQVSGQRLAASRTKPESRAESRAARTRPPRPSPAPGAPPRLRPPRRAPPPSPHTQRAAAPRRRLQSPPHPATPSPPPQPPPPRARAWASLRRSVLRAGPLLPGPPRSAPSEEHDDSGRGKGPSHAPCCAAGRQSRCGTEGRLR